MQRKVNLMIAGLGYASHPCGANEMQYMKKQHKPVAQPAAQPPAVQPTKYPGVAEVLVLMEYCARVQAAFPAAPPRAPYWTSTTAHTG